jgi:hypothetical protein
MINELCPDQLVLSTASDTRKVKFVSAGDLNWRASDPKGKVIPVSTTP